MYNGYHGMVRPDTLLWVPVKQFNMDGTPTTGGSYYATLDPDWSPHEVIIDAVEFIILLSYTVSEGEMLSPNTTLRFAGAPLIPCSWADVAISTISEERS